MEIEGDRVTAALILSVGHSENLIRVTESHSELFTNIEIDKNRSGGTKNNIP